MSWRIKGEWGLIQAHLPSSAANGHVMMILAGPRASGKSYLLRKALGGEYQLFGPEYDSYFRRFDPAFSEDFTEELSLLFKSVARLPHFGLVQRMPVLPRYLLVHLDIMTLCRVDYRASVDLRSRDRNVETMRKNGAMRLLHRYREVVLNTIYTPYSVASHRLAVRAKTSGGVSSPIMRRIYVKERGDEIYRAIYEAWDSYSATLPIAARFRSVYEDDGQTLRIERV